MPESKEVIQLQKKVYDNREIVIAGLLLGGLAWFFVDTLETEYDKFTDWVDKKTSFW